jgi:protein phosphatase
MPVVILPDPALVALVGAAGSGKSTMAARLFPPDEVLSSDFLRAAIAGDERDQRATRPAFAALHRALARRLASGRLTVVDATNVERHARRALLRRAAAAGVPAIAIVLDLPAPLVLARNAARPGRTVDPRIVRDHLELLRSALAGGDLATEGWSAVVRIRAATDLDDLSIERHRTALPAMPVTPNPPR